jgi:hypothetical protein
MNFLLKAFLFRRSCDGGFAIPMVMALGLIMLLLGIASIYKSSDQKDIATTQRKTSEALSVAEAGVAHYVEFLQRNSVLALYPYSSDPTVNNWTDADDTLETCEDSNTLLSKSSVDIAGFGSFDNQNVDGDPDKQYRLVGYSYSNGDNTPAANGSIPTGTEPDDRKGVLVVEGRSRLGNDFATAILRVEIPVRRENKGVNLSNATSPLASYTHSPTLWIKNYDQAATNLGNLKVKSYPIPSGSTEPPFAYGGNIVLSTMRSSLGTEACTIPTTGNPPTANNLDDTTKQRIIADPRDMPDIAPLPPLPPFPNASIPPSSRSQIITDVTDLKNMGNGNKNAQIVVSDSNASSLGVNSPNTYYDYSFGDPNAATPTDLILDGTNQSFNTISGTKVILRLNGDLTIRNGASINGTANTPSPFLEIYGGPNTKKISFQGNQPINIKAFIHAPDATVEVENTTQVNITGAMWVSNWQQQGAGSNSTITPDTAQDRNGEVYQSNLFYTTSPSITPKPTIFPPTKWETVGAN